jgi:sialate O-acetylesterase
LALWSLSKDYGKENTVYSGPLYKSMKVEGDKIRIHFAHTGTGLVSRDGKDLTDFMISGPNGEFVVAKAKIDGHAVIVSSEKVAEPKNVRFGWHETVNPNLSNKEGLPASPFKTDDWKGAID